MPKRKQKNSLFFKFDKIALILGFVVDTIAIVSIVLALKISETSIKLPTYISRGLAFTIWLIAGYIYLSFLHKFWENNEAFSKKPFGYFVFRELIHQFRKPALLFPGFVLIILLFGIVSAVDNNEGMIVIVGMVLLIILFGSSDVYRAKTNKEINQGYKDKIDNEWEFLSERIAQKLKRQQWLDVSDLRDVSDVWEIPYSAMSYAFSKYAYDHPKEVEHGYVYHNKDNVLATERVLINLDMLNKELYWHSSS